MKKAICYLQKAQAVSGAVFLAIFLITVVYQMFSRYLHISSTWTEDVAMYSFIWSVFMGASAMVYEKKHFAFTSFSDMMKDGTGKKILDVIISLLMLIFAILMVYYGIFLTKKFWNYTWPNIPSFKRGPTWLCVPLSGGFMVIYLVDQIIDKIKEIVKGGKTV